MKKTLVFVVIMLFSLAAYTQGSFNIEGIVKNAKGERLQSATVFIAGSQKATATSAKGEFVFTGIAPGTYQVVVNMLGYASAKQNVIVKDGSVSFNVVLAEKAIALDQVGSPGTELEFAL